MVFKNENSIHYRPCLHQNTILCLIHFKQLCSTFETSKPFFYKKTCCLPRVKTGVEILEKKGNG